MRIAIIAMCTFPIPAPTHTGDVVIVDLARSLEEMGHQVDLYAPAGSWEPTDGHLFPTRATRGAPTPLQAECEQECFDRYRGVLLEADVVHDFSVTKRVVENLMRLGRSNVISTLLGGVWTHPDPPRNIVVWSNAMRERGLRGATDYEDTPNPGMGGPPTRPIKDARVVYGGVDTDWYTPDSGEVSEFLWMNRWHPAKGYRLAIELARETGIPLVMAGEHPDREMFEYQRDCALEAKRLAEGVPNIRFEWLPGDPDHHVAKRALYRRAKALLYTVQFQEPFGLSQVEALACGAPVVGTSFGSVPEVIESGATGWVCSNDVVALYTACDHIDRISPAKCRDEAVRRFDRRVMARAYMDVYKKVLDGEGWG